MPLPSYAHGAWVTADDEGVEVLSAVTGEPVARVSSAGLDVQAMLDHARRVGGPALRRLTFHQRALMCKAVAAHLHRHIDELVELSYATGATRRDCAFDVDGGITTVRVLSSIARRELPNTTVLPDGPPERLSRRGTFVGQHVLTSRRGVAVQINAFNFPVWGMLEKLAPALIAGLPTIVKPATPTAYVAHRVVLRIIESGILPEGALQLVCGSVGDLLDRLDEQDVVAFTGSADTAAALQSHPAVVARAVRFNAERDSLNCSILGSDAQPGTPEFALHADEVVSELTAKAGQRCTAIRRVIVPAGLVEPVVAALSARLSEVRIGDPADAASDMGALAGLRQRDEVRAATRTLLSVATRAVGDADRVEVHGADARRGAFMAPQVLVADQPDAAPVHTVEAFGPVCTVLGATSDAHAVELARMGRGSLVASVFTHDPGVARDVALGIASWHGRVHVVDRDCAGEQTGHGSPLPHMVHGGPGRAGGGEELGGVRAVRHLMQRTAVQGSPAMVTAVAGRWVPGGPRRVTPDHPMSRYLEDLAVGDTFVSGPRRVTRDDIERFAAFTGDTFYAHLDDEAMADHPLFDGRVAHGYLVLSFAAGLFVHPDPGPLLANQGLDDLRFTAPVHPGDEITVALTCAQISPREDQPYGEVRWHVDVTGADGTSVASYELHTVVATRGGPPAAT